MSDIIGYFVWERTHAGPQAAKFHVDRMGMNKWSDDYWNDRTYARWPLDAAGWEKSLKELSELYPL